MSVESGNDVSVLLRQLEEERWRHAKFSQAESIEFERLATLLEKNRQRSHQLVDQRYGMEMDDLTKARKTLVAQNESNHIASMAKLEWSLREELMKQAADIGRRKQQWDEALEKLQDSNLDDCAVVDLNIGGQRFTVARRLLTKHPSSFFGVMFSGRWDVKKGHDGAIYIDRNPRVFSYILDWLRDDTLDVTLSENKHHALVKDAEFYQLEDLVRALRPHTWVIHGSPNGDLSVDQLTLRNTGNHIWDCAARGTMGWVDGVHEWTVRLDSGANDVIIGICLEGIHTCNASLNADRCYFVNCFTGKAFDNQRHEHPCFNRSNLKAGSLISIRLDLDKHEMYFGLDGVMLYWPTFDSIPEERWFPFFGLYDKDAAITIVSQRP